MSLIAYGTHALICKLQMEIKKEIKSYLSCSILESAAVRSEMKVVLRCENDVQVDALTVVDFTMLKCGLSRSRYYRLAFHCWLLIYYQFERERGRKETRDRINLRTDLFLSRTEV